MDGPQGNWIWGEMRPIFEEDADDPARTHQLRVVSRYALTSMFALFTRTLLWVLDGVFYTNPPEIRLYSVGVFLLAGFALWQILDLKLFARRLFIGVAFLTWGVAIVSLARAWGAPVQPFSSIQIAEYVAFLAWAVSSFLFVLYLLQPRVRELFIATAANPYQRALFVIALGFVLFFEWKSSQGVVNVALKLTPTSQGSSLVTGRFQKDCASEELARMPSSEGDAFQNFCRCDSKLLADRCPSGLASREQCLHHIETKFIGNLRAKTSFQEARESCVAQYFPKEQQAVYQKTRATLERNVLQRLTVALPLEKMVAGETAQRKFLYCMSLGLFSRCRDPKPSASQACLMKPLEAKESKILKSRCLRLAEAKQTDYDKLVGTAELALSKEKYKEVIATAEKAIAAGSDRSEGYLTRGIAYVHTGQHRAGIEDLTIALNVSDFAHTRIRALEARRIAHLNLKETEAAEADAKEACALGASSLCPLKGAQEPAAWHGSEDVAAALAGAVSEEAMESKLAWTMNASEAVQQVASAASEPAKPEPQTGERALTVDAPTETRAPDSKTPAVAEPPAAAAELKPAAAEPVVEAAANPNEKPWSELMQVGEVTLKMGDTAKAREKFEAALKFAEGKGEDLWAESSLRLASVLREAEKYSEGEAYLRGAIPHWSKLSERRQKSLVEEIGRYSMAYQLRRDWKLQERLLLEVWKQASDADSVLVRDINSHLSGLYQASGRADKLDTFYKREAEIFEKKFGKKDARAESSRAQLSDFYMRQGEPAKAKAVLASPVNLSESQ